MPASKLELNDHIKESVNGALGVRNPMLVSYMDENGQPVLSFRGSTQVSSGDQLAIWVRNGDGNSIGLIEKYPKLALMYRERGHTLHLPVPGPRPRRQRRSGTRPGVRSHGPGGKGP